MRMQVNGGGAIYNEGTLTITGTNIVGNTCRSAGGKGGAIYNHGELMIKKSSVNENVAEKSGGAIYSDKGDFKIHDSEFSSNSSPVNIISNLDSLNIFATKFISNMAENIIINDGDLSSFSVFAGQFLDNDISRSVIFNSGKFCTVESSVFKGNVTNDESENIINQSDMTIINPKIDEIGMTVLNEGYLLIRNSSSEISSKIHGEGIIDYGFESKSGEHSYDFEYLEDLIQKSIGKKITLDHDISFEKYEEYFFEGG